MATVPVKEDAFLASQCLDFCQMLAGKSLSFSFSLTLGTSFSFSVDTMGKGDMVPQKKKKKPTPSTQRRNARRREEFLKKKVNASTEKKLSSPGEPVSGKEAEAPPKVLHHHPSPSPSAERRQVIAVGKERARPTFSQLDGDPPSSPHPSPVRRSDCGMVKRCSFETNQIALRAGYTRKDFVRHGETSSDAT